MTHYTQAVQKKQGSKEEMSEDTQARHQFTLKHRFGHIGVILPTHHRTDPYNCHEEQEGQLPRPSAR